MNMTRRDALTRIATLAAAPLFVGCGADSLLSPSLATSRLSMSPIRLIGGGDPHMSAPTNFTAWRISDRIKSLLDADPSAWAFCLGDLTTNGTAREMADYYAPSWGRFKSRILPAIGNHDVAADRKAGLSEARRGGAYYDYWGTRAGERGKGYYAVTLGSWRIYVLNSEQALGEQAAWLRSDLPRWGNYHIMAMCHQPHMSSPCNHAGKVVAMDWPGFSGVGQLWVELEKAGCEAFVSGHCHSYQRYPRLLRDPNNLRMGIISDKGIRQFVIGTAGTPTMTPSSNHRRVEKTVVTRGVFEFRLHADRYEWKLTELNGVVRDSGTQACRKVLAA